MITVELYGPLACVAVTPSLLRRLLFRAETVERFACLVELITGGTAWRWDNGDPIEPEVLRAIEREIRHQRRPRAFAIEPPRTG